MDLYIDKNNLLSLLAQPREDKKELFAECQRLIRRQLRMCYNFGKQECFDEELLYAWILQNDPTGRGTSDRKDIFLDNQFPARPLKTNFRVDKEWEVFQAAYLLSDEKVETLRNLNSMLIGAKGEELELLSQLFCSSSFDLHSIYNIHDKKSFSSWEQLKADGHILPCSDIIIADRYLFANRFNKERPLDNNLFALLKMFGTNDIDRKINFVFFCEETHTDKNGNKIVVVDKSFCDEVTKFIEGLFTKKSKIKVTFVLYKSDRPHDRFMLTNYRLFRSGDSFGNYFDRNGNNCSQGLTLDVDSTANNNVDSIIKDIQTWFQKICNNNADRIIGARESNFIKFIQ